MTCPFRAALTLALRRIVADEATELERVILEVECEEVRAPLREEAIPLRDAIGTPLSASWARRLLSEGDDWPPFELLADHLVFAPRVWTADSGDAASSQARREMQEVPSHPLVHALADRWKMWCTGDCTPPFPQTMPAGCLAEVPHARAAVEAVWADLRDAALSVLAAEEEMSADSCSREDSERSLVTAGAACLSTLGRGGVSVLLGQRETSGSVAGLIPPAAVLQRAFDAPYLPSQPPSRAAAPPVGESCLSVGARAVAKHAHRHSRGVWDRPQGPVCVQNAYASRELGLRILHASIWWNVHPIPHGPVVCELRRADGFGARWTADGNAFRGLVEPPRPDGHARRWRDGPGAEVTGGGEGEVEL